LRGSKEGKHGAIVSFNEAKGKWLVEWGRVLGGERLYKAENLKRASKLDASQTKALLRKEGVLASTKTPGRRKPVRNV
jgi:hypothetical protein